MRWLKSFCPRFPSAETFAWATGTALRLWRLGQVSEDDLTLWGNWIRNRSECLWWKVMLRYLQLLSHLQIQPRRCLSSSSIPSRSKRPHTRGWKQEKKWKSNRRRNRCKTYNLCFAFREPIKRRQNCQYWWIKLNWMWVRQNRKSRPTF